MCVSVNLYRKRNISLNFYTCRLTIEKMDLEVSNFRFLWNRIDSLIVGFLDEVKNVNDIQMVTHR